MTRRPWVQHCMPPLASALVLCCASPATLAATSDTPEAQAYIERYGSDFDFNREQEIIALYTGILAKTPHDNSALKIVRAQKYGSDERQRLDVHYITRHAAAAAPIVLYFHGGGFVEGDTRISAQIYDNVGNYFARQGFVGLVSTYRLAPKFHWPSGIEDVAAAVRWAHAHGAQYGGDPNRIFLIGHSAGAVHVAGYTFSARTAEISDGVAGVILFSGMYTVPRGSSPDDSYFGSDPSQRAKQSLIDEAKKAPAIPLMVAFGRYDPIFMQLEALGLAEVLCQRDHKCPLVLQVPGHNHMSEVFHFDTADDSGAREITAFIRDTAAHCAQCPGGSGGG